MPSKTFLTRRALVLCVITMVAFSVLLGLWITRERPPEIEVISRAVSPDGKWVAKLEMVVYGDHHFVNDARYEVRVGHNDSQGEEALVYSIQTSGPIGTTIKWQSNEDLVVGDTSNALTEAKKQPHPVVKIEYRKL